MPGLSIPKITRGERLEMIRVDYDNEYGQICPIFFFTRIPYPEKLYLSERKTHLSVSKKLGHILA